MTGNVAIQPNGAMDRPTRPLMAMKVTLLVRNRPWQRVRRRRLAFMPPSVYGRGGLSRAEARSPHAGVPEIGERASALLRPLVWTTEIGLNVRAVVKGLSRPMS